MIYKKRLRDAQGDHGKAWWSNDEKFPFEDSDG